MIATSSRRVADQTVPAVNQQIRSRIERNLAYYQNHPEQIEQRLRELGEEWDVERALETASSGLSLAGLLMSVARGRRWLLVPLTVQAFFLQHALHGWCPPLPLLRRLGFRTTQEIEQERYALKTLRGDFRPAAGEHAGQPPADQLLAAVTR